jgi:hypothetical protein
MVAAKAAEGWRDSVPLSASSSRKTPTETLVGGWSQVRRSLKVPSRASAASEVEYERDNFESASSGHQHPGASPRVVVKLGLPKKPSPQKSELSVSVVTVEAGVGPPGHGG